MGAESSDFGVPDFETDSSLNEVAEAVGRLNHRQEATLLIVGQWIANPEGTFNDNDLVQAAIRSEGKSFRKTVLAYLESDITSIEQNTGIANLLDFAKVKRVSFLAPLAPEANLIDRWEREELTDDLRQEPGEIDVEELDEDDEDEHDQEDSQSGRTDEIVEVYEDELQFDIATVMEALQPGDEELTITTNIGKFVVEVSKISLGVAIGSLLAAKLSRRFNR